MSDQAGTQILEVDGLVIRTPKGRVKIGASEYGRPSLAIFDEEGRRKVELTDGRVELFDDQGEPRVALTALDEYGWGFALTDYGLGDSGQECRSRIELRLSPTGTASFEMYDSRNGPAVTNVRALDYDRLALCDMAEDELRALRAVHERRLERAAVVDVGFERAWLAALDQAIGITTDAGSYDGAHHKDMKVAAKAGELARARAWLDATPTVGASSASPTRPE